MVKSEALHIISYIPPTGIWGEQFKLSLIRHPTTNFNVSQLKFNIYLNGIDINTSRPDRGRTTFYGNAVSLSYGYELATAFGGTPEAILTMSLSEPEPSDVGIYEVIFKIPTSQVELGCCPEHRSLLLDSSGMFLQYYVVGLATVELRTTGKQLCKKNSGTIHCHSNITAFQCDVVEGCALLLQNFDTLYTQYLSL